MKCSKCGTEVPAGQTFCGKCGTRVSVAYNPMGSGGINGYNAMNSSPQKNSSDNSGMAPLVFGILALVCSLLSCLVVPIFLAIIFSILGIVMGGKCYKENGSSYARVGKNLSIAAIIITVISVILLIIVAIVGVGGAAAYDQYQKENHPFQYWWDHR